MIGYSSNLVSLKMHARFIFRGSLGAVRLPTAGQVLKFQIVITRMAVAS